MSDFVISTDSCADLTAELYAQHNIYVVPFIVTIAGEEYYDGVNIDSQKIFDIVVQTKQMPKTACPSIAQYVESFKPFIEQGKQVLHFSIGQNISGAYQNACVAAEQFPGKVFIVNTHNLSSAIGIQVLNGCDMRARGMGVEEVAKELNETALAVFSNFSVYTLDYLKKGGRVSSFKAFVGSILRAKPILGMREGKLNARATVLGNFKRAIDYQINELLFHAEHNNLVTDYLTITHAYNYDGVKYAKEELARLGIKFDHVYNTIVGSTIASHCGPMTLGILYRVKDATLEYHKH